VAAPGARPVHDPDRPAARSGGPDRDAPAPREYARPQAFAVGTATRLVRGGLYGKDQDGYSGYYMEP
jgi:hypothetical protein